MPTIPDQREMWMAVYGDTPVPAKPSAFVEPCLDLLPTGARILELGCGTGGINGARFEGTNAVHRTLIVRRTQLHRTYGFAGAIVGSVAR